MSRFINDQLKLSYELIKQLHKLYIKYNNIIEFKSFESCGKGIDTIYDIVQTKPESNILISTKIIFIKDYDNKPLNNITDIFNYVLLLPTCIITPLGKWTFIDNPKYIKNISTFSIELFNSFNLKLVYPACKNEYNNISDALFVSSIYDTNIIDIGYILKIYDTINDADNIHYFNDVLKFFINDFTYGSEISLHLFDKFITSIYVNNVFDDKKVYFLNYINSINKDEYFKKLKLIYHNKKKYGYDKNIYRAIFYYTYLSYFE